MKFKLFNLLLKIISSIMFILLIFIEQSSAFKGETHSAINNHIVDDNSIIGGFSSDQYLKNNLGFVDGVKTNLNSLMIKEWLSAGGKLEDSHIILRYLNHFHDPISNTGLLGSKSALEWALMETGTQLAGDYSWWDARNYYFKALTDPDKETRETYFAKTFRAVGQVMHLVQDMSVPEHARKDGHYFAYDYEKCEKTEVHV